MTQVAGEVQILGPFQWLALGMALRDKDALARVLAMKEEAFGLSPDGLCRKLRRALADKSVRGWLTQQGLTIKEGAKASDGILALMEDLSRQLEERKR